MECGWKQGLFFPHVSANINFYNPSLKTNSGNARKSRMPKNLKPFHVQRMQCKGVRMGCELIPAGPFAPTISLCLLWELGCPKARDALAVNKALLSMAPAQ